MDEGGRWPARGDAMPGMRPRMVAVLLLLAAFVVVPAAPAAAIVGVQHVVNVSGSDSRNKTIHAYCPPGTSAVGGGARISGGGEPYVHLTMLAPLGPDGYAARAEEFRYGTVLPWELTTWALCASQVAGLAYRSAATEPGSGGAQAVTTECPNGTYAISVGAEIVGGGGQVMLRDMHNQRPLTDAFAQATEDRLGHRADWSLTVHAICADVQRYSVRGGSALDGANPKASVAPCGAWAPNAVGFTFSGPIGSLVINDVMLAPVTYGATAYMLPLGQPPGSSWSLTSYTICVG
jgi:hypothetical protein